ncbi:MAG: hypothetical protein ABI220_02160 [Candidatus Saccharimonadales bacterium]
MLKVKLSSRRKLLIYGVGTVLSLIILAGGWYGYVYASTPAHIRKPSYQHYHFRTQIVVDDKAVDFSKAKFQKESDANATTCSAAVGSAPIDFHDKMDQLTHVHWSGMTGGEFLKDFGWNYIGGNDGILGQRFDTGLKPSSVNIYGKLLPTVPKNTNFYIYTGDKDHYQSKRWNDFLNQDLESFFGKQSNIGHSQEVSFNVSNWLFPKATAHGEVIDEHASNKSEEELTRINNVVGNVVIFAQQNKPTNAQVKAKLNNLVPLHESSCGD